MCELGKTVLKVKARIKAAEKPPKQPHKADQILAKKLLLFNVF